VSFESLLLLAFFVLIPLLARLVRAVRARSRPHPADLPQAPTPAPTLPRPPMPERAPSALGASEPAELPGNITPPTPASPPLLAERHPATERLTSRERARAHRVSQQAQVAPQLAGHVPRLRRSRRSMIGLRHSIVMMAILGRCKALDHDSGSG
jgi:hypothetical protein